MQTLHAESSELLRRALESLDSSQDEMSEDLLLLNTMSMESSSASTSPITPPGSGGPVTTVQSNDDSIEVTATAATSEHLDNTSYSDLLLVAAAAAASNINPSPVSSVTDRNHPTTTTRSLWNYWNRFIQYTYPLLLLFMVFVLWPAGWFALKRLLTKTDSTFHSPIPGSPSSAAQDAFTSKFPNTATGSGSSPTLLVVLQLNTTATNSSSSLVHHEYARESSLGLESYLSAKVFGVNDTAATTFIDNGQNHGKTIHDTSTMQVSSYYGFQKANLSLLSQPFLSKDEHTTFVQVTLQLKGDDAKDDSHASKRYLKALMAALEDYYYYSSTTDSTSSKVDHRLLDQMQVPQVPIPPPNDLVIGFTGLKYFSRDLRTSTQHDLQRMDAFVLPLALIFVGVTLLLQKSSKSLFVNEDDSTGTTSWIRKLLSRARFLPPLLVLPFCGMLSTVSLWSLWMDSVVVSRMQITQFTPSIMMSLTLGMGIDYTLFLVARYLEAKAAAATTTSRAGVNTTTPMSSSESAFDAIQIMLEQAGKVVLVSGTTLLCTFLALVALPLPMLQSVGIGAAVAIASAMLMNLLVIPALLYTRWLRNGLSAQPSPDEGQEDELLIITPTTTNDATEPLLASNENNHDATPTDESPQAAVPSSTTENTYVSIWIRLAKQVLHPYKSIIIVLVILQFLLWPVAWNARRLDSSDLSFESLLPEDSPSLDTYHRLIDGGHFGPGKLAPFRILLDSSRSNTTMDTAHAFDLQHDLVQRLLAANTTSAAVGASFVGISVAGNRPVPYSVYLASKLCGSKNRDSSELLASSSSHATHLQQPCSNDALRCLHFLDGQMVSEDRFATYMIVELESVSPFDREAIAWLDDMRLTIDVWMFVHNHEVDVYVDGTAAVAHDAVQAVYSSFPRVIVSTLAVVFVLLGCVFRSIIPPLRSVVSITFTLAVSFGLAVLVYQDGIWDSWHIRSLTAVDPEISWLVPIMSFSIIVGLALDYDVFLVTRILEFRFLEGYGHESSIAAGLDSTGGIITSAGCIMALSFGSLLGSQSPALDQWAFLVTTAVLLDTFVVRTILVPAMMGWTGSQYSWWPRTLPRTRIRLDGFDVDGDQDTDLNRGHSTTTPTTNPRREPPLAETLEEMLLAQERDFVSQRRETMYYETVERPEDLAHQQSPETKFSSI